MTIVEFFDSTAVENICVCLAEVPERVILVGEQLSVLQAHARRYRDLFAGRGYAVEFLCRAVRQDRLQELVEALSQIALQYAPCAFDLTGGGELCLVAAGIVSERYRDSGIRLLRLNLRTGTLSDCGKDDRTVPDGKPPVLSVEENIRVYGGKIIYEKEQAGSTRRWDLNAAFQSDIDRIWDVCKSDPRLWNVQIGVLKAAEQCGSVSGDGLRVTASVRSMREYLERYHAKVMFKPTVIGKLAEAGLLTACENDGTTVRLAYKDEQVRRCLTKAGQALEMKVLATAVAARDEKGARLYHDVMNGVRIDWDGIRKKGGVDTENEVDVLMMRGAVPIFVSCKNGGVDVGELYKLETVASRFGGRYAGKVLVASLPSFGGDNAAYLRSRAKDMKIRLVEGVCGMSDEQLETAVRDFCGEVI